MLTELDRTVYIAPCLAQVAAQGFVDNNDLGRKVSDCVNKKLAMTGEKFRMSWNVDKQNYEAVAAS
jgi:hypothetical protein